MPSFGKKSKKKMEGIHPDLIKILNAAIKRYDFTVLEGLRTKERQRELVDTGKSQTMNSKHLTGHAVDLAPWPIDWNDTSRFKDMLLIVLEEASQMGIGLRIGGNWKSFKDYPHIELKNIEAKVEPKKESKDLLPDGPSEDEINVSLEDIEESIFDD